MASHPFLNSKKTILWVEVDVRFREEITVFLTNVGRFEVIARENASGALETLRGNPRIDLILADHRMVAQGSELSRVALEFGIPIIILAGTFEETVRAIRLYSVKIPVIKKPFSLKKLLDLINHYLKGVPLSGSPVLSAWWVEKDDESE